MSPIATLSGVCHDVMARRRFYNTGADREPDSDTPVVAGY